MVKETEELLSAVRGLTSELKEKSDDGVINLGEVIGLADNVKLIIDESKDFDAIKAELSKLGIEEIKNINIKLIDIVGDIVGIVKNKPKFKLA